MSMPRPDLGLLKGAGFARCSHCGELIDAASRECRFCKAKLNTSELRIAAEAYRKESDQKRRLNDRRALIAGVFSLLGVCAYWLLRLAWEVIERTWWKH